MSKVVERYLMGDHVHMRLSIPPKYAMANVVQHIKGKNAMQFARKYGGHQRNFTGENFWAREYVVSTVGLDKDMGRAYIHSQEKGDQCYDQIRLNLP